MAHHFLQSLRGSLAAHASRPALLYGKRRWSYAELAVAAERCAAWLQGQGMASGDRVALVTPNKLLFLIGHLGVFLAGGVPLPLNPRFTREELRYFWPIAGRGL